ncbi:hypothetical protein APHAL10511_000869 [Amanita phalloides]|nr:hypothetical protein APHAL10511_000869 [Amanita phalloides]
MGPADFRSSPVMDDLLSRLQDLNIPHYSLHPADPPPSMLLLSTDPQSRTPDGPFALSMSFRCPPKQANADFPTVIDTFAPRPMAPDLSPPSSTSSERDSTSPPYLPSNHNNNHNPVLEGFVATRSRVVRLSNLPLMAHSFLSAVFLPQKNHATRGKIPEPISLWTLRDSGLNVDCVWAVFRTHEEASAVLSLSGPAMSVTGALESDLEPYQKLQPFKLKAVEDFSHVVESRVPDPSNLHHPSLPPTLPTSQFIPSHAALRQAAFLRSSSSYPDLRLVGQSMGETTPTQKQDYTISTNPPNPRSNFRIGDWM